MIIPVLIGHVRRKDRMADCLMDMVYIAVVVGDCRMNVDKRQGYQPQDQPTQQPRASRNFLL